MFVSEAVSLARGLMNQHGVGDWTLQLDNAKKRAGRCNYTRRTISLSRYLISLNDVDFIKDTILHEIAHALAGPFAKHGPIWKMWAMRIGAKPERCFSSNDANLPEGRWRGVCKSCNRVFHRHRRPKRPNGWHCRKCGPVHGAFNYALV